MCLLPAVGRSTEIHQLEISEQGWGSGNGHFFVHHPPDPVNMRTGNFFLPLQDLYLPCYGFPLEVYRAYNSVNPDVGIFGRGWTFNYNLRISISPGDTLTVIEPDGFINVYVPESVDKINPKLVDKIVAVKKKEDKRNRGKLRSADHYEKIRARLLKDKKYFQNQLDIFVGSVGTAGVNRQYVSSRRGRTLIYKSDQGYVRETMDGRKESYDSNGFLRFVEDRYGNRMTFRYNRLSRLVKVEDACGQSIQLTYNNQGRVTTITDHLLRSLSYNYDDEQKLIASRDLAGKKVTYLYDKKTSRMAKVVLPGGEQVAILYDKKSGRVKRQSGPGKKVTRYEYGRKGSQYFWSEVKGNDGFYNKFEYYPKDRRSVFTNEQGKKQVTITSKCCGKPLSVTNIKGQGVFFRYDQLGNIVEEKRGDNLVTKYGYEPGYNQVALVMTPDHVTSRFSYDDLGNLVKLRNSNKQVLDLDHSKRGRITSIRDHQGNLINLEYNDFGKAIRIEKNIIAKGREQHIGEIRLNYRSDGQIGDVTFSPNDLNVVKDLRQTLLDFFKLLEPAAIGYNIL